MTEAASIHTNADRVGHDTPFESTFGIFSQALKTLMTFESAGTVRLQTTLPLRTCCPYGDRPATSEQLQLTAEKQDGLTEI